MPSALNREPELTDQQKKLVRESFAQIERMSEIAGLIFYKRLFELDPKLRPMFHHSIEEQSKKLMATLKMAVDGLEQQSALVASIRALGRRHLQYGVKQEHYETVGQALLWMFQQALGPAFTEGARRAWATVYQWLAETMKHAAAEVETSFNTSRFKAPRQTGEAVP